MIKEDLDRSTDYLKQHGCSRNQRRQQQAHERRQALLDAMLKRELRRLPDANAEGPTGHQKRP